MKVNPSELMQEIVSRNMQTLEKFDPDVAIGYFDNIRSDQPYNQIPSQIERLWRAIAQEFGDDGFDAFQKITLLRLIECFERRSSGKLYSEVIKQQFCLFTGLL